MSIMLCFSFWYTDNNSNWRVCGIDSAQQIATASSVRKQLVWTPDLRAADTTKTAEMWVFQVSKARFDLIFVWVIHIWMIVLPWVSIPVSGFIILCSFATSQAFRERSIDCYSPVWVEYVWPASRRHVCVIAQVGARSLLAPQCAAWLCQYYWRD